MATTYHRYLNMAYHDERVWAEHAQEIRRIVDYANDKNIHLVVVVFPALTDIAWSRTFTDKVVHLLRSDGIPVVDLSARLSGRSPHELVVNSMDAHASVGLNAEVASLLLPHVIDQHRRPIAGDRQTLARREDRASAVVGEAHLGVEENGPPPTLGKAGEEVPIRHAQRVPSESVNR